MGISILGVSEDGVWQPYKTNHIAVQGQYFHCAVVSETTVCPRLGKNDINLVFLKKRKPRHGSGYSAVSFNAISFKIHH